MESFKEKSFEPKAHILSLLGEELIKSPVMAIYELVKNSYDADATNVNVVFNEIEDVHRSNIVITDNGIGMTEGIIENVWLEPGTDFRKPIDEAGYRTIKRSPIYKRVPMGEKGVGRFAVHKLSNKIKLITRPRLIHLNESGEIINQVLADYEIHLAIDWGDFRHSKYLKDVKIRWQLKKNIEEFYFKTSSGTRIELSHLKEEWSKGMARQLKRHTLSMLSPKNNDSKFKINLDFKNLWLSDFPSTQQVLEEAPYKLSALVDADYNLTFEYKFQLSNNPLLGSRSVTNDDRYNTNIKGNIKPFYRSYLEKEEFTKEDIELLLDKYDSSDNVLPYGSILLELYSYDLDAVSLKDTSVNQQVVKDILKEHAGVKVFKGDLRVYDYGDPGNDWLGLDLKRVQNKEWFSNNQNIGYVYLDPALSSSLIEKTNREGFIENESYRHFKMILEYILTEFKAERQKDRKLWLQYNKKAPPQESLENQLNSFKELINNSSIPSQEQKDKLLREAERIEHKYEDDKKTLLLPAGVGMTASFALHEIEKLVPRMEEATNTIPLDEILIRQQVSELREYVDGILTIMKKGGDKAVDVEQAIKQAITNYNYRLSNRNISIQVHVDRDAKIITCDRRFLITMLMNIIDNSIYWLETIYKDSKGIYVKVAKVENSIHILVVDNGPGFKDDIEDIVRPFFTRKENGIGIGMYLIDTIMMQYGKLNIVTSELELIRRNIPEFYRGAAVELIFSKNQNT